MVPKPCKRVTKVGILGLLHKKLNNKAMSSMTLHPSYYYLQIEAHSSPGYVESDYAKSVRVDTISLTYIELFTQVSQPKLIQRSKPIRRKPGNGRLLRVLSSVDSLGFCWTGELDENDQDYDDILWCPYVR